jgi:NADH-quinone oxidoreductase subunit A
VTDTITGLAILIDAAAVVGLLLVFLNANRLLGPRAVHAGDGLMPYETGMPPLEQARDNMAVLYYRFAVLFVVFDVDLAFLLPWAYNREGLDLAQATSVTVFVALVFFMLVYFWRKGALECQ